MKLRRLAALASVAAVALGLAGPALSASASSTNLTWVLPAGDLSVAGHSGDNPFVVVSSDGSKAIAIWEYSTGSSVEVQSRSAAIVNGVATWGAVTDLTDPAANSKHPRVALSADGAEAVAVWTSDGGGVNRIMVMTATITGTTQSWSPAQYLTADTNNAFEPRVAMSANGNQATAAWAHSDGSNFRVESASATVDQVNNVAHWGSATILSDSGEDAGWVPYTYPAPCSCASVLPGLALGMSTDGTSVTLVWLRSDGSNVRAQSVTGSITGTGQAWGTPGTLSASGGDAMFPQVAVSSTGTTFIATWQRWNGTNYYVQTYTDTVAGTTQGTGSFDEISMALSDSQYPSVSLSIDGSLGFVSWTTAGRIHGKAASIVTSPSLTVTWDASDTAVTTSGTADDSIVRVSADGTRAAIVYKLDDGTNATIQVRHAVIVEGTWTWGEPIVLTSGSNAHATYLPQLWLSSDGTHATAIWLHDDSVDDTIVQSASAWLGGLPATGSNPMGLVWTALVLLGLGSAAVVVRRRAIAG
jgi:LPXTG-motif cell wall-anchored protein